MAKILEQAYDISGGQLVSDTDVMQSSEPIIFTVVGEGLDAVDGTIEIHWSIDEENWFPQHDNDDLPLLVLMDTVTAGEIQVAINIEKFTAPYARVIINPVSLTTGTFKVLMGGRSSHSR